MQKGYDRGREILVVWVRVPCIVHERFLADSVHWDGREMGAAAGEPPAHKAFPIW